MLLEIRDLYAGYAGTDVLKGISLKVESGAVCILGPNGVGKTTLLRCISGAVRRSAGSIVFRGMDVSDRQPWEIARAGIAHVPEGRRCFVGLTVLENLKMGAYTDPGAFAAGLERMLDVFPALRVKLHKRAETLSGGQQQMLAIARGLIAGPRLLLLDEPTQGLAPVLVAELRSLLSEISRSLGVSVLLVEQNPRLALAVTDRAYVLHGGRVLISDRPTSELTAEAVVRTYLAGSAG